MKQKISVLLCLLSLAAALAAQTSTDPSSLATLEGTTTAADGQPLRKSTVTLRPQPVAPPGGRGVVGAVGGVPIQIQMPTPYGTTSDAQGKFSFTGLEPGRYTLSAEHTGYLNSNYGMKRSASGVVSGNTLITLTAGQHMTNANIEMTPQSSLSGKVTDEDGDPLQRVRVTAMKRQYVNGQSRLQNYGGGATDEKGEYKLTDLQAGRYYITFIPQRNMGQALRRAGAAPGEPEMDYATSYYPGGSDFATAMVLNVAQGEDRLGIDIQMHKVPVYHVRGRIQGDLAANTTVGGPGSRMQIMVNPSGGDVTMGNMMNGMQMVSPDGSFDVSGLTPGTWSVSAIRAQGQMQILGVTTVQLGNRDIGDLVVGTRQPVEVSGSVKIVPEDSSSGASAPRGPANGPQGRGGQSANGGQGSSRPRVAQVVLAPLDTIIGGQVNAMVQSDGSFTLKNVAPVRYRLMVQPNQLGYLKSATLNGQDVLQAGADMENGGGTLSIVYSMTAAEIDGTVTRADDQPATEAIVTIVPDPLQPGQTSLYRQARTDASGAFTARGFAPGKYKVYAWEDIEPGVFMDPDFIKPFDSLGVSISVDENDRRQVSVKEISAAQMAEVNKRAGR